MARRNFEVEVEKICGYCSCKYKEGDKFIFNGLSTPNESFCGGAFMVLFPMINALHSGARFNFEENPYSKTKLACPDNGNVIFKITLLDEENKIYKGSV